MTNLEHLRTMTIEEIIKAHIKFIDTYEEGYCNAPDCIFADYCNEGESCDTGIRKWAGSDYSKIPTNFDKWKRGLTVVDYAKMAGTQNCPYGLRCCGYDCEKYKTDEPCEFSDALVWGEVRCLK